MHAPRFWTALLVGCCVSASALAQAPTEAPPPSAAEPEQDDAARQKARERALFVLGRHIRAVGGKEIIRAAEFVTFTGKFEIRGAPFIGRVTSMRAEPPRLLTRLELGPMGTLTQGYDGRVAWTIHPSTGPAVLDGPERTSMIRSADVRGDLHYEQNYPIIEFLGDDTFEGQPVFAIRLVDHDAAETIEYYSKGSGLRVGVRGSRDSASGPIPFSRAITSYTEYERLKVPTTTVETIGTQVITLTIDDVSFAPIDESVFELPEPIKALVQAQNDIDDDEPDGAP